jgi:hypothetical protein
MPSVPTAAITQPNARPRAAKAMYERSKPTPASRRDAGSDAERGLESRRYPSRRLASGLDFPIVIAPRPPRLG